MKRPGLRRRWVVLGLVIIVTLAAVLRLLYQPLELQSYQVVDPQNIKVVGFGAETAWTRVAGVNETDTSVTISGDALSFEPFPHTDAGYRIEVPVHLSSPLGNKEVIDGSTGFPITQSP
jgi:hypothetical protein